MLRAGTIRDVDVRVATRDDGAGGPTFDVAHEAASPRRRWRTCKTKRLWILAAWHDGTRSPRGLANGATPRPPHDSGPEPIPCLFNPRAQATSLPTRSGRMLIEKSMTVRLLIRSDQCHAPDGLSMCTNG